MNKITIFILAVFILVSVSCTLNKKEDTYDYSQKHGRYVEIHRTAPNPTDKGLIKGTITDIEDGKSIPYVNIILVGTTIGTVTNKQGYYELEVYFPRKYVVDVRSMGYYPIRTESIEVENGKIIILNFEMTVDNRPKDEPAVIYH